MHLARMVYLLECLDHTQMHYHAAEKVHLFLRNLNKPEERIDTRLLKQSNQQAEENRCALRQIVWLVEFVAKQALPFSGHS